MRNSPNKHGETKYRYYEKYKDSLTNNWRRVSMVFRNDKQLQKVAQKRLNKMSVQKKN